MVNFESHSNITTRVLYLAIHEGECSQLNCESQLFRVGDPPAADGWVGGKSGFWGCAMQKTVPVQIGRAHV